MIPILFHVHFPGHPNQFQVRQVILTVVETWRGTIGIGLPEGGTS